MSKTDREICEAAGLEKWEYVPSGRGYIEINREPIGEIYSEEKSIFSAHFNPSKVAEMLAEIAQLKAERDEAYKILDNLWRATKGIDPVTGKAWLTPKMEIEAKKIEVVWNEERGEK